MNLRFTDLLRAIAREEASAEHQDRDTRMTNLEVLARRFFSVAMGGMLGSQRAGEMIVERLEGKAVQGERPVVPDTRVEDQLDLAEAALLNSLTKDGEDAVSKREASDRQGDELQSS